METLVDLLEKETQSLKIQYIEKTKEYVKDLIAFYKNKGSWTPQQWCDHFGIQSENGKYPISFYNTKNAKVRYEFGKNYANVMLPNFEEREVKKANDHYTNSIIKLAQRIEKKNLNIENITLSTSHIGMNIETTISDGEKQVYAYTIIAEGLVQRPHYRYLVK